MSYCNYRKWRLSQFIKQKRYRPEFNPDGFRRDTIPSDIPHYSNVYFNNYYEPEQRTEEHDNPLTREDVEHEEGDHHMPRNLSLDTESEDSIKSLGHSVKHLLDNIRFVLPPVSSKGSLRIPKFHYQEVPRMPGYFSISSYIPDNEIDKFMMSHPEKRNSALAYYVGSRFHNTLEHPNFSHPLLDKIEEEGHRYPAKHIPKASPFRELTSKSDLSRIMGYYSSRLYEKYMKDNPQGSDKISFLDYAKKLNTGKSSERVRILHNILTDILEGQHLPTSKANKVYGGTD